MAARTPAEKRAADAKRKRDQRAKIKADAEAARATMLSDESLGVIDEFGRERTLSIGEQLLTKQIALCNQELHEFEMQFKGVDPPWLRAIVEQLGTGEITLNTDGLHAAIDRKRATLARLLSELRQYGMAAAKANASKSTGGTAPTSIPAPAGTPTNDVGTDEYTGLFATG